MKFPFIQFKNHHRQQEILQSALILAGENADNHAKLLRPSLAQGI